MQATFLGVEFLKDFIQVQKQEEKFVVVYVHVLYETSN